VWAFAYMGQSYSPHHAYKNGSENLLHHRKTNKIQNGAMKGHEGHVGREHAKSKKNI